MGCRSGPGLGAGQLGRGAEQGDGLGRSLFVVGDRKQSIYSFQGADLRAFEAKAQRELRERREAGAVNRIS